MLAYGVTEGATDWSSSKTLTGLIVGGVALLIFIVVELFQKQPLLELRVFGSSDFTRGVILTWISQIALIGSILMVPLYLQNILGYTALKSGLTTLPMALCSVIFMPIGGRLFDKLGARPLAFSGLTIISVALFLLSKIDVNTTRAMIMLPLGMMGAGMGLSMMSLNTHVLNSAPRRLVSRVTPLTTASQQVIMSFAVTGLTGYLTSRIGYHMAEAGSNPIASSTAAFGDTFFVTASIAACGVILSLILRKPRLKADHEADEAGGKADVSMMMGH
jgi:nitrate/nitrite transporter NarK